MTTIDRSQPSYFSKYRNIRFERSEDGILVMSLHNDGGPLTFTAQDHEAFVDAFYDVADGVFTLWSYFVGPGRRAARQSCDTVNGGITA
jgi:hypothetical protein